jgi:hypothetical protein
MWTSIWNTYGDVAMVLYALLSPWLPMELAYIVAALWPMLLCLAALLGLSFWFTWQDRRTLNRLVNARLDALDRERHH